MLGSRDPGCETKDKLENMLFFRCLNPRPRSCQKPHSIREERQASLMLGSPLEEDNHHSLATIREGFVTMRRSTEQSEHRGSLWFEAA